MSNGNAKFDPQRYAQAPALRLSTGCVLRIPLPIDPMEVTLPGNFQEFAGGLVALYDGASKTGMVYLPARERWTMMQPIERDEFNAALACGQEMESALISGSNSAH